MESVKGTNLEASKTNELSWVLLHQNELRFFCTAKIIFSGKPSFCLLAGGWVSVNRKTTRGGYNGLNWDMVRA